MDSVRTNAGTADRSNGRWNCLASVLHGEVDIAWLVVFRIAFGALMVWEMSRLYSLGWIETYYVEPTFHFKYFGFGWVKPWPGNGMYIHIGVMALAAAGIMLGFCYRVCAAVFVLGFTYLFLIERTLYLNHFYLICLISLQMVFIPAHRAWSIDAWLRPGIRSMTVPAWTLWNLRFHVALPYFFGGIAKFDRDWLLGIPMRVMLSSNTDLPIIGKYMMEWWMADIFAFGGLLFDLTIVLFLLRARTRIFAYLACLWFHLTNALLLNIGVFPWLMIAATLIFFPPDWPRRLAARAGFSYPGSASENVQPTLSIRQHIVSALFVAYVLAHMVIPFRHWLYPGHVSWTEEGAYFSWRMKLRGKAGIATFRIVDPKTGDSYLINPSPYLNERQRSRLGGYPDLVLQFAHFLHREHLTKLGYGHQEVRAEVWCSLNGRDPQLLIDPTVNLAAQPRNLWPASWIRRLDEPISEEYFRARVPYLEDVDAAPRPGRDDTGSSVD